MQASKQFYVESPLYQESRIVCPKRSVGSREVPLERTYSMGEGGGQCQFSCPIVFFRIGVESAP